MADDTAVRRALLQMAHDESHASRPAAALKCASAALAGGSLLLPVEEARLRLQMCLWGEQTHLEEQVTLHRRRMFADKTSLERAAVLLEPVPGWRHFATACAVQWRLAAVRDALHAKHGIAGGFVAQATRALSSGLAFALRAASSAEEAGDSEALAEAKKWVADFAWAQKMYT